MTLSRVGRAMPGMLILALILAGSVALMRRGTYGLTLFLLAPFLLGAVAAWIKRPQTSREALANGFYSALIGCGFLLVLGFEGIICIAMALPLAIPLAMLGSWLTYKTARSAALFLLVPPTLVFDTSAKPPVYQVHTAIEIAAPPETVWKHVVTFSELPAPDEWYFRAGLAFPMRARIDGIGPGAVRRCEFSTGPFVEPIEVWDEPRKLSFRVTENPAPMHEWSPYARVLPRHLHGYLVSEHGQFLLTRLPGNRTLVEGTTWYRHGLWPAEYWRLWSDAIIHRIHLRVLQHIRTLSEAP